MYEKILESLALPQYTKILCENKECSYILIGVTWSIKLAVWNMAFTEMAFMRNNDWENDKDLKDDLEKYIHQVLDERRH
jgi:hypothetical protein